jgi:ATP synthase protein I
MSEMKNKNNWQSTLWKKALWPSLFVSVLALILGWVFKESAGLWGALLATFTVVIFFSVHLGVALMTRKLDPISTMALAMLSYLLKVTLTALFLILVTRLTSPETIDRTIFGATAIALIFTWLAGEIRAFLKLRFVLDVE